MAMTSRKNLVKKLGYTRRSLGRVEKTYKQLRANSNILKNIMSFGGNTTFINQQWNTLNQKTFKQFVKLHTYYHKVRLAEAELRDYDEVIYHASKLGL
jgi:hypothetical protein